jgi:hypothetical protein
MIFLLSACLQSFRGNSNQRRTRPSTIVVISKEFLVGGVLDEGMDFEDSFVLVATTGAGQSKTLDNSAHENPMPKMAD